LKSDDALRAARRTFGNTTLIHESSREAWMFVALETVWQNIRYGLRTLGRSPGFGLSG
jgi:hypothetical protein